MKNTNRYKIASKLRIFVRETYHRFRKITDTHNLVKKLFWFFLIILMLLNVIPLGNEVNTNLKKGIGKGQIRADYLLHALTFLCFAGIYALKRTPGEMIFKSHELPKIISIIIVSAILFETVQFFLPYRAWNLRDLVSNLIGAGLAVLIILILNFRNSKKIHGNKPS